MATVEIEAGELEQLQNAYRLLQGMQGDARTRRPLLQMIKTLAPGVPIPELDAAAPVLSEVEATRKAVADMRAEVEQDRAAMKAAEIERSVTATIERERQKLADAGYGDEEIKAVEELMEKRGIADYEAASALFEKLNPDLGAEGPGIAPHPSAYLLGGDQNKESQDLLMADPNAWAHREVAAWQAERAQSRRAGGRWRV